MYVDIVTVQSDVGGKKFLRTAPFMSHLHVGDRVIVEQEWVDAVEVTLEVIDIATFNTESEEYKLLTNLIPDAKRKVIKKIIYEEMNYEEGEENG